MGTLRSSGVDLFGQFVVGPGNVPGQLLLEKPFNPALQVDSRLQKESELWQRWRPVRLVVRYIGAGPATAGGSMVLAWSPDSTHSLDARLSTLSFALSQERSQMIRLDQSASFEVPCQSAFKWYVTDEGEIEGSHGSVIASLISAPSGIRGSITVCLSVEWTIEWQGRKLAQSVSEGRKIQPDSGYSSLFTTSDSSYDSSVLTFKAHAGGSMVPFSLARPGAVYTLGAGVHVPYVDEQGQSKEAAWFSLVVGYTIKGLVLHSSEGDASDYQRSGDIKYCLKYKAAGGYVTPARPSFLEKPLTVGGSLEIALPEAGSSFESRLSRIESAIENFILIDRNAEPP